MRSRLNGMVSIGEEACTGLETDGPRYFILKTCSIIHRIVTMNSEAYTFTENNGIIGYGNGQYNVRK